MHARIPLPDPGPLRPFIASFEVHLRSEKKADNTRSGYLGAATRLAGWLLDPVLPGDVVLTAADKLPSVAGRLKPVHDWVKVKPGHIKHYMIYLLEVVGYDPGYANNQYRAIQQFWRWFALEEDVPNPMIGMTPPKPGEKLVPVIEMEQIAILIKDAESQRTFEARRDAALLRLFACSGCRLSELTNLKVTSLDIPNRRARVVGKGDRERWVRFDNKAAQALDRYLRVRAKHAAADLPDLWIGVRRRQGMTPNGVRQVVSRRAARLGMKIYPHMWRHTFSHNYLDRGGAEGDLMEQNGWTSPQMLRRYGASARAARAARAYDRIDVMGGI